MRLHHFCVAMMLLLLAAGPSVNNRRLNSADRTDAIFNCVFAGESESLQ